MCQKEIVICNELKLRSWIEDNVDQVWTFPLILSYSSVCRSEIKEFQVHIMFQSLIRSYVGLLFLPSSIDGGGGWSHGCIMHRNRNSHHSVVQLFLDKSVLINTRH